MGLLDGLRRRVYGGWRYYPGAFGVQVANLDTAALYRTQPNLRAVISYLADNAAQVPLKVHKRVSNTDRPRVLDSPAALLLQHPNDDMTPFELKRAIYTDLYLYGRCLVLVFPDSKSASGWQLRHIPATWIISYEGDWAFSPEFVVISHDGQTVKVPSSRFILFHEYDPADPMCASSPVEALKETLFEQVESGRFRRQMWQKGGRFNAYIQRPKDVERWTDEAFDRFKRTWDESWAGDSATEGGKMPILEDGMSIQQVQFNSREAQWAEAKKLGREDTAGVYHINPALIWPGSGQTYASAKDNARALYNEALAPKLMEVTDRLNQCLLPIIGEPADDYIAYDITIKTQGSFEEMVSALQSATGAPFLTRDEARAKLDLPAIDGADELIVPLNVVSGGILSPDTGQYSVVPSFRAGEVQTKSSPIKYKAKPDTEDERELVKAYKKFFEHQRDVVLSKLGAKAGDDWWDADRWNRELSKALYPIAQKQVTRHAKRTLKSLGLDENEFSEPRTEAFVNSMCERRAKMMNDKTKEQLDGVADWEGSEDADRATYAGVFDMAIEDRSESAGAAFASAISGWAALEAVNQCAADSGATKTWVVTSGNPRPAHAMMDGETVPYNDTFSNGAEWPGDDALDAADVANCQCQVEITIP